MTTLRLPSLDVWPQDSQWRVDPSAHKDGVALIITRINRVHLSSGFDRTKVLAISPAIAAKNDNALPVVLARPP